MLSMTDSVDVATRRRLRWSDRGIFMAGQGRITVVDRHIMFTGLIEQALARNGYRCQGIDPRDVATVEALASRVAATRPEVVVLNLELEDHDALTVLGMACRTGARVVILTENTQPARVGQALTYGAHAVVDKSQPLNELLSAVRKTAQGLPVLERGERDRLVAAFRGACGIHHENHRRLARLTVRERQILAHLMDGQSVAAIARISVVSEATVRTQVKAVLAKLEVSSQLAAVALARTADWIAPSVHRLAS